MFPELCDTDLKLTERQGHFLKVGFHAESSCQHQPASFSAAFKMNDTACLVGWGVGVEGSLLRLGTCYERGPYLLLLYHFTPLQIVQGVLTHFTNYIAMLHVSVTYFPPCHMSTIRNSNVSCHYLFYHCVVCHSHRWGLECRIEGVVDYSASGNWRRY